MLEPIDPNEIALAVLVMAFAFFVYASFWLGWIM